MIVANIVDMKRIIISLLFCTLFLSACNKESRILSPEDQLKIDIEKIEKYLEDNNISATQLPEGVFYVLEDEGDGGEKPDFSSTLELYYKGYLMDGTVFDEADRATPTEIKLSSTIVGWQIGIPEFSKNSKGKLFIPSGLGYGNFQFGPIPGKSVLIFDIELSNFF